MSCRITLVFSCLLTMAILSPASFGQDSAPKDSLVNLAKLPESTWVKLSPLAGTPPSPRLGYEGACAWDAKNQVMIRYGGHNQGGGGEQGSEIWTFDPRTAKWSLREPNLSPPGICCGQQNLIDPTSNRYVRFPAFSASHGWQWWREVYLNDSSVWTYDLGENKWRNMRPLPAPHPRPLRCASWDTEHQVIVMFGGEGSNEGTWTYDPWENTWKAMKPAEEPPARSGGNMAYDSRHKVHILFGTQFDDERRTWAYDLAANTWTDLEIASMPPTSQNDAVLTYEPSAGLIVAIVKVTTGKDEDAVHRLETWTLDVGEKKWMPLKPMREPDPTSSRARQLMFAPELGVSLLENRPANRSLAEQQIWALHLPAKTAAGPAAAASPSVRTQPRAPDDVVVSVIDARHVEVTWSPASDKEIAGYFVERAAVEVASEDQLKRLKAQTLPLESPSVGVIHRIGSFSRLNDKLIAGASFTDSSVDLAKPVAVEGEPLFERKLHEEEFDPSGRPYRQAVYAYRVHAVSKGGVVGGPSAAVLSIPSSPQYLFSKEEGTTCHLKWQANPEKAIRGYRIYRMDGRYSKDPIVRLTEPPQKDLIFSDDKAGKDSRRYYIVAVDALGQEGFPSSPVWFNREWQSFYKPFVGEWHQ